MSYELLKLIVVVLGPVIIFATVSSMLKIPEEVAGMPAISRHALEVVGALLIGLAWFYIGSLGGGLALIGLLLLATPTVARYISRPALSTPGANYQKPFTRSKGGRSVRSM